MAFNLTTQTARLGNFLKGKGEIAIGISALDGSGAATVKVQPLKRVDGVLASAQSSNTVNVTATATNTFTLAGTASDNVMWVAWGVPRL